MCVSRNAFPWLIYFDIRTIVAMSYLKLWNNIYINDIYIGTAIKVDPLPVVAAAAVAANGGDHFIGRGRGKRRSGGGGGGVRSRGRGRGGGGVCGGKPPDTGGDGGNGSEPLGDDDGDDNGGGEPPDRGGDGEAAVVLAQKRALSGSARTVIRLRTKPRTANQSNRRNISRVSLVQEKIETHLTQQTASEPVYETF